MERVLRLKKTHCLSFRGIMSCTFEMVLGLGDVNIFPVVRILGGWRWLQCDELWRYAHRPVPEFRAPRNSSIDADTHQLTLLCPFATQGLIARDATLSKFKAVFSHMCASYILADALFSSFNTSAHLHSLFLPLCTSSTVSVVLYHSQRLSETSYGPLLTSTASC